MQQDEKGGGYRLARLQELILEELRGLLRDDVTDPDLHAVVINALVLSVDYRHARVHFSLSPLPPAPIADATRRRDVERALVRATPFLRARLAEAIDMKRVPDLRFVFDAGTT